ncbi:hypothetical protein M8C21_023423 [Ambrosia artemisiifolia]|uniref:Uncharacterized protein n=1 Tax=Ambrosia artemisiifolia TaxID=4212 RepID=A0AAD5BRL9_AMBAR|nr:hypothetical protein M8C21_023423 [Ambrosia artemisiifolia]
MEIEEETTSNHQEQPVPAAIQTTTTTVLNETSITNTNTITTSSEHESVKKLLSESNTKEEEEKGDKSLLSVHKSEDTETIIMSEVMENEALSGGVESSVVVESVNVVVDDGVNVDNDDVAAVECDGGGGENLMSLKDENEGDEEDELVMVNEEGVGVEQDEVTIDGVSESYEKDMVVEDEEKCLDGEIQTENLLDAELDTEKSLDTDIENDKLLITEVDNSLDTEMENEKSFNTEKETEKSLDTEIETVKSLNTEIETDKLLDTELETDKPLGTEMEAEKSLDAGMEAEKSLGIALKLIILLVLTVMKLSSNLRVVGIVVSGFAVYNISAVREKEKKCLCEACMRTVMLIEKPENQGDVNFDDKNSWEHLFKDYWIETKAKHNLSLAELEQAKNPWKKTGKQESLMAEPDIKDDNDSGSDNPPENRKTRKSKRNAKKQKSNKEDDSSTGAAAGSDDAEWVSKDLLEFVTHMRNGDSSVISQYEVQDLLLEYIKRNKLRDPNRKSQIICDARLENLFGKPRVAHIEMLKLLESHFLVKEDSQIDDFQGTVVDTDISPVDDKDKKRKGRKKSDKRGPQSNRDDYAAIDTHNISLIYLRRKLVEDLLDDMEKFHEIIVGTFVRIRISGAHQKQDMYRLVQVTGTSEAARYTLSKRTTCTMLEILNLDKTETISIDNISNQDFMEDECKRLRQSIKCGLISRLTVGDVLDKAMELQPVRVNDWFETEVVRLNHLRDRASDLGRKKEYPFFIIELYCYMLSGYTPEERARRLDECPLVHDDPTMDPEYGSEDDTDSDDKKQGIYTRDQIVSDSTEEEGTSFLQEEIILPKNLGVGPLVVLQEKVKNLQNLGVGHLVVLQGKITNIKNLGVVPLGVLQPKIMNLRNLGVGPHGVLQANSRVASPSVAAESAPKINESEKMWHYKDPSEKIQGPFSMVQLRKWSKNGYFPAGLKIWRKSDKEGDGILLTDALEGKFTVVGPKAVSQDGQNLTHDHTKQSVASDSRHEPANFPSTPNKVPIGWTGGHTGPLTGPNPPLIACGNKDGNLAGSIGVSTVQPHDSSTNIVSIAVADAPQNISQDVQNPVQPSQLSQQVTPPDSNMQPQMVQSVSSQNPQGWPQNFQPNPSMNMAGLQPLMYHQWPGVPNMVQNPAGNFMPAPQEQWGQQFPFPVNQPVMQQPQPQQPLQPNVNWGPMVANPNMGWVGPNTGNPMNWVPMVQGPQVPGTVDPTWAMQAGWVPQPVVQGMMPNQSWVATPTQGPVVAGNGNPGWVGPGWVPPAGNQGTPPPPGNPNQNWGPRNHGGNWGGNENRGNFSGQKRNRGGFGFGGRSFNKQESFHRDGGSIDRDDGPTHKDNTSFQGDDARSSEQ